MKEESVESIKKKMSKLGLMLPGKINTQWTQCKTKGCKCMDEKYPRKHGPYNQLSFTFAGKSSTMNIKKEDMKEYGRRATSIKRGIARRYFALKNLKKIMSGRARILCPKLCAIITHENVKYERVIALNEILEKFTFALLLIALARRKTMR